MNSQLRKGGWTLGSHSEHVIRFARQLVDGERPGVLSTVDDDGVPHARWMDTVCMEEFPHLYALTSPTSRKIAHIRRNPRVDWMFKTESSALVVNISGTARLVTERAEVERIWQLIERKNHTVFLGMDSWISEVTVIDTRIDCIDCTMPRYGRHYTARKEDFPSLPIEADIVS